MQKPENRLYQMCYPNIKRFLNNLKENGQELEGRNARQILKMKGFTSFAVFKLGIWNAGIMQGTGEQAILPL